MQEPQLPLLQRLPLLRFIFRAGAARIFFGVVCLVTLVALFYAVENWKGKRVWDKCRRELTAQGLVLDWEAYVPPAIPDDQNIYKAPHMTEWFVKDSSVAPSTRWRAPTNGLQEQLGTFSDFHTDRYACAEIAIIRGSALSGTEKADLVLTYEDSLLSLGIRATTNEIMPLIRIDDAPLLAAIRNLGRQASLQLEFDPKLSFLARDKQGKSAPQPYVSLRLENSSAKQALTLLLDNHDLQLIANPETGLATVTKRDERKPKVIVPNSVREQLTPLVMARRATHETNQPSLMGATLLNLYAHRPQRTSSANIVVQSDREPSTQELTAMFSHLRPPVTVSKAGPNRYRVSDLHQDSAAAEDYVEWSDQLQPEFDAIREALQRPAGRIEGSYEQPFASPTPNYVTLRQVAQTLSQRAQCYLLLGQQDKAIEELTLLHELRRLLHGQPQFLVTAMIDVALVGLYQSVINDGFELQQWKEPQLIALQKQLLEIDLLSSTAAAFRCEPAAACRTLEQTVALPLRDLKTKGWVRGGAFAFLVANAPRGWLHQNMATVATLEHQVTKGINTTQQLMFPARLDQAWKETEPVVTRTSPYTIFAAIAVPNFRKALQNTAATQTRVNLTLIAAALERYRAVHNDYPESLDPLSPRFIETIPHDIVGGQPLQYKRTADGKFLLYSVGWDEKDDLGKPAKQKEPETGDWVWAGS